MRRPGATTASAIVLIAYFLLALLYSLLVPLGEAPDEVDHYAYVRYLIVERRLPEGPAVTQGKHPPLYYLLAALVGGWAEPGFDFVRANPDFSLSPQAISQNLLIHTSLESFPYRDGPLVMHLVRLLSVLLSTVTVWAVYRLAGLLFPAQLDFALGVAGFLAFVPGVVFISGTVNNDNLVATLSAWALLVCARLVREGLTFRRVVALGTLLGLGLLAKVGALAVWPTAALALTLAVGLSREAQGRGSRSPERSEGTGAGELRSRGAGGHPCTLARRLSRSNGGRVVLRWLGWNGLAFGLALALAAPWLIRNWRLYGDPLGWALVRATVDQRMTPLGWADLGWLVRGWFTTFWGRFGGAAHIYLPTPAAYGLLGGLTLFSVLGLVRWAVGARAKDIHREVRERRSAVAILALLIFTLISTVLSVIRYSAMALGTDQARLLWPALAPLAILFFLGLAQWVRPRHWGALAGVLAAAGFIFSLLVLLLFLRPIYAPPAPVDARALADIDRSSSVVFDGRLALVGHALSEPSVAPGGVLRFTLYWRAERRLDDDLRAEVWVLAPDGGLVASWKRSPTGGRFSTDRWPVSLVYADDYALPLPDWLPAGEYTLAVGVRESPSEAWLPPVGEGADTLQQRVATVRVHD